MSKESRESQRQEAAARAKLGPCPVDRCTNTVDPKSNLGLCPACDRIGRVVDYGVSQILEAMGIISRKDEAPAGSPPPGRAKKLTLFVPKPGLGRQAIAQAAGEAGVVKSIESAGRTTL